MSGLLIRLLAGWRLIRVSGPASERLITQVIAQGYRLWNVQRRGDELSALLTEEGYAALDDLAKSLRLTVTSERQGGLPFRWSQMRLRPFLFVGFATAWLMVGYATSHVWAIKVGTFTVTPTAKMALIRAAEQSGLQVGVGASTLDIPQIRRTMLTHLPQYSWIGIRIEGMVAVIDGIRLVTPPPSHLPPRLVALRSGKVTAIFVYMGEPDVVPGERVHKGQSLISGVVSDISPNQPPGAKKPLEENVITPAQGEVMADVHYRVTMFQAFVRHVYKQTGRTFVERFIEFEPGSLLAVPGLTSMPFSDYNTRKIVKTVRFSGVDLPVRMIDLVYNERVIRAVRLSRRQAIRECRRRALDQLEHMVPKEGKRISDQVQVTFVKKGVRVTLNWVVNSNIAASPNTAVRS